VRTHPIANASLLPSSDRISFACLLGTQLASTMFSLNFASASRSRQQSIELMHLGGECETPLSPFDRQLRRRKLELPTLANRMNNLTRAHVGI
jgi:hypothetical protein